MPVDPAPGSTPGRPNPFGFPAGHSAANTPPATAPSNSGSPGANSVPKVRLLRANALAQSLPTGTAMGFSMEYQFLSNYLPNAQYAWIIQPPQGNAVAIPVRLQAQGTLSQFVPAFGSMEGTYKLQLVIFDGKQPRPMSRAIDAYYSY